MGFKSHIEFKNCYVSFYKQLNGCVMLKEESSMYLLTLDNEMICVL